MATHTLAHRRLAFTYDLVRRVIHADEQVDLTESAFLAVLCPPEELRAAGLLGDDGHTTSAYDASLIEARVTLGEALSLRDKLVLIKACLDACVVDGQLDPREVDVFQEAVALLGVSDDDLDLYLETHPAVGTVELDDPIDTEDTSDTPTVDA